MRFLAPVGISIALSAQVVQAEAPKIVTDIAPVHGLVSMVTGDVTTPSLLIEPGTSPHLNAMRPSAARALQDADVVFWIGPALSPWLEEPIETLAPDAIHSTLLDLEVTRTYTFRDAEGFGEHDAHDHDAHGEDDHDDHGHEEAHAHDDHNDHGHKDHDDHGHEDAKHDDHGHDDHDDHKEAAHDDHGHEDHAHDDHGHAHDHSGADPHAWLDAQNAQNWLTHIAETLSTLDPENAATYAANAEAARAVVEAERVAAATSLAPVADKPFVLFHDAYQYFEIQFGLEAFGALSLSDAVPPSASHVAEIQAEIREEGVACVFSEPQFSDALVRTVIDGTDAKTVELDPLGADLTLGAQFYPNLIRSMAEQFVTCLQ